jgi:transketolase
MVSLDKERDVLCINTIRPADAGEVALCIEACAELEADNVRARVISMPSWELFEHQSKAYRDEVLPPAISARVAVEQASTLGWAKYVGASGAIIGMEPFGASAPLRALETKFGFTPERIVAIAREQLEQN